MKRKPYNKIIEELVRVVQPLDEQEIFHQKDILNWIQSGPDTPPKHHMKSIERKMSEHG